MKRKILSILLMLPLTFFGLVGCSNAGEVTSSSTGADSNPQLTSTSKTVNLMEGIVASNSSVSSELDIATQQAISSFAMELFTENLSAENSMVSPISIVNALAMTSNGAVGETLTQIEDMFGVNREEITTFLKNYNSLLEGTKSNHVGLANSIWFKNSNRLEVKDEFLQVNKDYFDADVYSSQFDEETLKDINTWVSENTDGMIDTIIDEIPSSAIMYLINAVVFDAEWEEIYSETKVNEGEFYNADGSVSKVDFMTSTEQRVIELENGVGFIKPYKDNEFSFIGILPNGSVDDLANELSTIDVNSMVATANFEEVDVILPKFSMEYSTEMSDLLTSMGMELAFDSNNADFSDMAVGDGKTYIGKVLHKTFINVDEKGTQAGATTAVEMMMKMAMPMHKREIRLDSSFIYMIIDNNKNIPLFIGKISNVD